MKPIKIQIHNNPIVLDDEDTLLENYECIEQAFFLPEFLEKMFIDAGEHDNEIAELNRDFFKSNDLLVSQAEEKEKYNYIGSIYTKEGKEDWICEYYYNNDKIYVFLIVNPNSKKYYTRLESLAIYQKKEGALIQ